MRYETRRENEQGELDDAGLPVVYDADTGAVVSSPFTGDVTTTDTGEPAPTPPPRSGPGSGKEAWAEYAEAIGVVLDEDDTKEEIVAKLTSIDAAGSES